MGKQMEGDNKQRRKAAREARRAGATASESGFTTGGSKQSRRATGADDHEERLANIQHGEAKQAGHDVPSPLRGKGRRAEPRTPPQP